MTPLLGTGRSLRINAALAALALASMSMPTQAGATPPPLQPARRRSVPLDSRVRNLANKEVRDWNSEVERKKAEKKGSKYRSR